MPGLAAGARRGWCDAGYDQVFTRRRLRVPRGRLLDVPRHEPRQARGRELCASSSNRNFKGRQGSPTGRTLLMSPVMVAAAAIAGEVTDARELFGIEREGA